MSGTPAAASPRISWSEVPEPVRRAIEAELGSPVSSAVTQLGGFSPGAAVRIVCADGRRAFVKAVGASLNPDSPRLHRAEIRALQLVPPHVPAPSLLFSYDDGDWVALLLEDIVGRRPAVPWAAADAATMSETLTVVSRVQADRALPPFADTVGMLSAWDEIAADVSGIDASLVRRLPEMLEAQGLTRDVTRGEALVHWDARNDNVLIEVSGRAVLLDWAWACRGAGWLDTVLLAADFCIQGGPDADGFLARSPVTRDVPPAHLRGVVACMVGVWTERARRPAPPGLPTIREWQAHCGRRALQWLDDGRWG